MQEDQYRGFIAAGVTGQPREGQGCDDRRDNEERREGEPHHESSGKGAGA